MASVRAPLAPFSSRFFCIVWRMHGVMFSPSHVGGSRRVGGMHAGLMVWPHGCHTSSNEWPSQKCYFRQGDIQVA